MELRQLTAFCSTSKILIFMIILSITLSLNACGGSSGSDSKKEGGDEEDGTTFDQKALLTNVTDIMQRGFADLAKSMSALDTSITQYCSALDTSTNASTQRVAAQESFKTSMNDLQQTLLFSMEPSIKEQRMAQLYSWPLTSPCQIDLKLANNLTELNIPVDKRGMDALEYLLFVEPSANHSCPDNFVIAHPILSDFNTLSTDEKQTRRCAFMQPVASDAASSAQKLSDAWDVNKGNFAATLLSAEEFKQSLNLVTDAMFYFEEVLKENKLDAPLGGGLTQSIPSCGAGQPCPQDVESPHARISKENLLANMLALQSLYHAGATDNNDKLGFNDWLIAEDNSALASSFATDLQTTIDAIKAIDGTLYNAIENNVSVVNDLLLGPIQTVSKALRFDVLPSLGLSLPAGSESDTD